MRTALAIIPFLLLPTAASAASYVATLSGGQEVPAVMTMATGTGSATVSGNMLSVKISFSDLSAPLGAAHIHCCAATGSNAGVAVNFMVPALTTGSFSAMYDLSLASTYTAAFLGSSGGTAALAQARLINAFDNEQAYFNLHNARFPGGEIRGQIAAVPEPASWAMMIGGFGLVGGALRRRSMSAQTVQA